VHFLLSQTLKAAPHTFTILSLLILFSKAPIPINRVPYSMYFTCWIWIEKLLRRICVRCLWGLFPLSIRSHLEWFESSQVATFNTYLGGKPHSKWRDPFSIHHISICFLRLFHFFHYSNLSLCSYVLIFFHCQFGFYHDFMFPLMFIKFLPFIINHEILVFFLCPLEVNLHTYLTTWLSLCPVGIFFGFSPYNW